MALYIYHRVSTDEQDFLQQKHCVDSYLERNHIKESDVKEQLIEKMTGVDEHTHRKFAKLLAKLKEGDTLFFSELSRIGRNMTDLNNIVNYCCTNGITLMQCKDATRIENETIGGKALLFALSLAAEIEVANIRQRTQMALDARKKIIQKGGKWVSKSGRECTRLGRPADRIDENGREIYDLSAAQEAASQARTDAMIKWREKSQAVRYALRRRAEGAIATVIVNELGSLYDDFALANPEAPNPYATPKGCKPSAGTISKWLREANPLVLVG